MGDNLKKLLNIQLVMKLLTFTMAINVVTPLPFITGSQYFWFLFAMTVIYNVYLMIKDIYGYIKKHIWEMLFIISCLISALINYKYENIYSVVIPLSTAVIIFNMMPIKEHFTKEQYLFEKKVIFDLICIFTFVIGILSIVLAFIDNPRQFVDLIYGARFYGLFKNSNQLAFWAFISMMISYNTYQSNKVFHGINIFLEVSLILISGCRSVLLALFIFFIYLISAKIKNIKMKKRTILIIFIVGVLLVITISLVRYQWLFRNLNEFNIEEIINTLTGLRYYIWKDVFNIYIRNPIFGVGVNNLQNAAKQIYDINSFFIIGNWEDPHNLVLTLFGYVGIVGFILFLKIIIDNIKLGLRLELNFELIFIVCLLTIGLLDIGIVFDDRILSVMFWYLLGIINMENYFLEI